MKPRILFLLQNICILLVWVGLFFAFDRGEIFDLVFEGIFSLSAFVFFLLIVASCIALSYFYETYAHRYLMIKKPNKFFWIILAASLVLFITIFGLMKYLVGTNADLFSPEIGVVFLLIGTLNNLATVTILVIFLIFMIRKPMMPAQHTIAKK